jgi:hypothetical protein
MAVSLKESNFFVTDQTPHLRKGLFIEEPVVLLTPKMNACSSKIHLHFSHFSRVAKGGGCGGHQGCQMVCFQTKYPNLGKFWKVLLRKIFYDHLVYFTAIGNILWQFGIFCGNLVYFSPFWYFGPRKIWQPWRPLRPTACILFGCKQDSNTKQHRLVRFFIKTEMGRILRENFTNGILCLYKLISSVEEVHVDR